MAAHRTPSSRTGSTSGEVVSLEATTRSVPAARRFVRASIGSAGLADAPGLDVLGGDLELIASELVTNAVEHGTGDVVDVEVAYDHDAVTLAVTSRGNADAVAPTHEWNVADVASITGRGLGIVRALADNVDVRRRGDQLRISVERHVAAS